MEKDNFLEARIIARWFERRSQVSSSNAEQVDVQLQIELTEQLGYSREEAIRRTEALVTLYRRKGWL